MNHTSTSAWFVAQTQPMAEVKASANLIRQGFEVYLPRYLKTVRHARRVTKVKAPLFPSYIFVRIDTAHQRWRAINSTVGVSRLVGHEGLPSALAPGIVEGLKRNEGVDGFIELIHVSVPFRMGDAIRVLTGAFDSCCGIFEAQTESERVTVLLEMLGRKVRCVTHPEAIELV